MSASLVLDVEKLTVGYLPGEPIVRSIDLRLGEGEAVGILGPNGAGKSTVLRGLAGVCPFVEGDARLKGQPLLSRSAAARVRAGLGFVPRDAATFLSLSVEENLRMGAFVVKDQAEVKARFEEILALIPLLKPLLSRTVSELSGGQAELVAIGLGLMSGPAMLMIDEPSAGLSVGAASGIVDSLAKLVSESRLPLLLVEQNLGVARQLCSRFYVLESGGRMVGEAADFKQAVELLESTISGGGDFGSHVANGNPYDLIH